MPERATKSIIVKGEAPALYELWANFENFPSFMRHVESVSKTGNGTSHWIVMGPLGRKVEWIAETTRLEPNKRIAWSTKDHEGLTTSGEVSFNALPHGDTEITVTLQYVPPAGVAGRAVASLFKDLDKDLEEDLRSFKSYAERARERTTRQ